MGANFKYPSRPSSVPKDDWNPLPAKEEPQPKPVPKKSDPAKGFVRLVDFIRTQLKEKPRVQDPEVQKRRRAISAYKKTKSA